jgi:hypothetical protein
MPECTKEQWDSAVEILNEALNRPEKSVSIRRLKELFRDEQFASEIIDQLVLYLQFPPDDLAEDWQRPSWFYKPRSFYRSKDVFDELYQNELNETEEKAKKAAEEVATNIDGVETDQKQRRQDEARLVPFVVQELENIYDTSRDVSNQRKGGVYENVDVIAAFRVSENRVEFVSVEVKLEFNATAVQQAVNYCRFSDRVWVAIRVMSDNAESAASELQQRDMRLFDYVISSGIGILGCYRRQGPNNYSVFPIHWPCRQATTIVDREAFIDRYRAEFEEMGVLRPSKQENFPQF